MTQINCTLLIPRQVLKEHVDCSTEVPVRLAVEIEGQFPLVPAQWPGLPKSERRIVQESGEGDCGVEQPSLRETPTNSGLYPRHMIGKRVKSVASVRPNPVAEREVLAEECLSEAKSEREDSRFVVVQVSSHGSRGLRSRRG